MGGDGQHDRPGAVPGAELCILRLVFRLAAAPLGTGGGVELATIVGDGGIYSHIRHHGIPLDRPGQLPGGVSPADPAGGIYRNLRPELLGGAGERAGLGTMAAQELEGRRSSAGRSADSALAERLGATPPAAGSDFAGGSGATQYQRPGKMGPGDPGAAFRPTECPDPGSGTGPPPNCVLAGGGHPGLPAPRRAGLPAADSGRVARAATDRDHRHARI